MTSRKAVNALRAFVPLTHPPLLGGAMCSLKPLLKVCEHLARASISFAFPASRSMMNILVVILLGKRARAPERVAKAPA